MNFSPGTKLSLPLSLFSKLSVSKVNNLLFSLASCYSFLLFIPALCNHLTPCIAC